MRRHTRWPRDWSSDVCSSALGATDTATEPAPTAEPTPDEPAEDEPAPDPDAPAVDSDVTEDQPDGSTALPRSEEHTSELQSRGHLVCRLLLEKKKQDNARDSA